MKTRLVNLRLDNTALVNSTLQEYHQKKPEAERHKDRLMDITLTVER